MAKSVYERVLLKLSGEALMGSAAYGINAPVLTLVAGQIAAAVELGARQRLCPAGSSSG